MVDSRQHTESSNGDPEPIRPGRGATILGPRNAPVELERNTT
jgi:hypothetical protein